MNHLLVVLGLLVVSRCALSIPVFPSCVGYGCDQYGGSGRNNQTHTNSTIFKVTNLNGDNSEGSFLRCVEAKGPRICIFEISGTIPIFQGIGKSIVIRNPYIFIAGETAPSPGISLSGASFVIVAHDVVIRHITVRTTDQLNEPDSIGLYSENIVLDHISASYSVDECISSNYYSSENYEPTLFTISNSFVTHSLHDSTHAKGPHGKGSLFGPGVRNFTIHHNLYAHHIDRNVLISGSNYASQPPNYFEIYNNIFYNYYAGTRIRGNYQDYYAHKPQFGLIVKNWYIPGPNTTGYSGLTYPVNLQPLGELKIENGSSIYVKDNWSKHRQNSSLPDTLNVYCDEINIAESNPLSRGSPESMIFEIEEMYTDILLNSGSRPKNRDREDQGVVEDLKKRSGSVINCVDYTTEPRCNWNAGGYEQFEENYRELKIPQNYWEIEANGYTKLENWIFAFGRELEVYDCFGIDKDDPLTCSSNGICIGKNNCECIEGWEGNSCESRNKISILFAVITFTCFSVFFFVIILSIILLILLFALKTRKKENDQELTKF